jgi:hypothetical protein
MEFGILGPLLVSDDSGPRQVHRHILTGGSTLEHPLRAMALEPVTR